MGFYFKLAPGVKIRATGRGLRASVGPRTARGHFGAGGTGLSTGAGPVSLYQAVGGGRGRGAGPSRTSIAAYERQLRQADKLQEARELQATFQRIVDLHREEFTVAAAPVAPSPQPIDSSAVRKRHEQEALRGFNVFQRSARASAREQAGKAASFEVQEATARQQREHADLQRQLDEQWHRLLANDPDVVFATLTEGFDDNEAPAAIAGVHDSEASVIVMAPDIDVVPERMPKATEAGNLSLGKLTKSMRDSFYLLLVCGYAVATVREALAVAPGIESVRLVMVRRTSPNAYGLRGIECLMAAAFAREALRGIQWQATNAAVIVQDASTELRIRQGAADVIEALDLSNEPDLAALLQAVGLGDLGEASGKGDSEAARSDLVDGAAKLAGDARVTRGPRDATFPEVRSKATLSSKRPSAWRPRPQWGTVRDYVLVTNDYGGTDAAFRFILDDGSEPIPVVLQDTVKPELGEYARGIMPSRDELTIKVGAATMIDAEAMFQRINELEPAKRALMHAQRTDIAEDCGWAWTHDYKLVKAASGLIC
jgi:hypothetical protein